MQSTNGLIKSTLSEQEFDKSKPYATTHILSQISSTKQIQKLHENATFKKVNFVDTMLL